MGTPDFAVPALRELHSEFGISAVVTVPDKPIGRGRQVQPSAVKSTALELGITTILQPESLKSEEFLEQMSELKPDIICVIAFRILPRSIYTLAKLGSFNVHASLLPKYRGSAPINHAIINGEIETGVTSFLLNDVVDTGTILLRERISIPRYTTAGELYTMLQPLSAQCAVKTVRGILDHSLTPESQDDTLATPAPKVWREESWVNWNLPAKNVCNAIHGVSPVPCAWTELVLDEKTEAVERIKIYRVQMSDVTEPIPSELSELPGSWIMTSNSWFVRCGDGDVIRLTEIQLPNKQKIETSAMLRGWRGATSGRFIFPE
jgi:methionyl-tRNA formyltransferase